VTDRFSLMPIEPSEITGAAFRMPGSIACALVGIMLRFQ
jgi:hypothetical protein